MPGTHTPRRIACLQPSATVIFDAIGELARVVACTRYCADVVPEVADVSRVILADSWTADTAEIVATRPDLVIASVPYQEKAVIEILRAGARFLGLAPKTLADIYADIAIIAGAVGAMDRGEAVIAAMQRRIYEVRSRTAAASRPRVWCEEWGKPRDRLANVGRGTGRGRGRRVPGRCRQARLRRRTFGGLIRK
jgi:iron complex transport system substrate-binding protein